eukprot:ANDGO_04423.mRNA.1 DNA polymerase epsilon catalytic subunit A
MRPSSVFDEELGVQVSALELYFIQNDDVRRWIVEKFEKRIVEVSKEYVEDLSMLNHLSGLKRPLLKIQTRNVQELMEVRKVVFDALQRNKKRTRTDFLGDEESLFSAVRSKFSGSIDPADYINDIREYDVKYHIRVSIDLRIRVGYWYRVYADSGKTAIQHMKELERFAEPKVCAFDIETTKAPLKFPDAKTDQIMMISYMIDRKGYLIVNRQVVSQDIEDFEYTPKPEYEGPFTVFNVANERELLNRWISELQATKPSIMVTFNGDFFDWPFIDARCQVYGIDLRAEIGYYKDDEQYMSKSGIHMDAFAWVKRDSYLPQGSQGLKAVTKAKLGYDPLEIHPEDMMRFAEEKPWTMASYSVSDAVATYYLYMKYVHPFIFSLCTIIPMSPDEVLRKGSGTLCETLLMVEATEKDILCPDKYSSDVESFFKGHRLESETYVGGHVEALQSGVFRSDIPMKFHLDPTAFEMLLNDLDKSLKFAIEVESGVPLSHVVNYDEVRSAIASKLEALRDNPRRMETPLIYHLDVSAMYPNIILTNRLQPVSIVDEATCAACVHNRPESDCQRKMNWIWRGEFFKASRSEYEHLKTQMQTEVVPQVFGKDKKMVPFGELPVETQDELLKKRVGEYSRRVYKRTHETQLEERESIVCQRENPFYVDTVRLFRDRRYEYKAKHKTWQKHEQSAKEAKDTVRLRECSDMVVLYDSLQLAHKCILNSFYGYVMRRGARWYSMEMAGIVTHTGANIIKMARSLLDRISVPLELDTDGIWTCLPCSFPENFTFKTDLKDRPKISISYPCAMLNADVHHNFSNHQYQVLDPRVKDYSKSSECTISFEIDGPYLAMILPAALEEGKSIKKRYAVFDHDHKLKELKGFEVKRRGELELVKVFQSQLFPAFLEGKTLQECYDAVGALCNHYLDILYTKGVDVEDDELLSLISESSNMSRSLEDYGSQKSTAISTAKRLAEFLGAGMVKDKGLNCTFIISKKPEGLPVTERAIPVAIFSAEESVRKFYLRKWCRDASLQDFGLRDILDWNYYIERLSKSIQKIVTIPSGFQKMQNPVPRVVQPDWLSRVVRGREQSSTAVNVSHLLRSIASASAAAARNSAASAIVDLEDMSGPAVAGKADESLVTRPPSTIKSAAASSESQLKSRELENAFSGFFDPSTAGMSLGAAFYKHEHYPQWLATQKEKWRELRAKKRRRALVSGKDSDSASSSLQLQTGIGGMLRRQADALVRSDFELLCLKETEKPGVHRAWYISETGYISSFLISLDRTVLINTYSEDTTGTSERVFKVLPHGRVPMFLYQHKFTEDQYLSFSSQAVSFLNNPDVEGIYESGTSPLFRFLVEYGSLLRFAPQIRDVAADSALIMRPQDLVMSAKKDKKRVSFVARPSCRKVFIYSTMTSGAQPRGIAVVLVFESLQSVRGAQFLLQPFRNLQVPRINSSEMFQQALGTTEIEVPSFMFQASSSVDELFRNVESFVHTATNNVQSSRVFFFQGSRACLPHLSKIFGTSPVIDLPVSDRDTLLPALDWIKPLVRTSVLRAAQFLPWYERRIEIAAFAKVPLGNIDNDVHIFCMDVILGRQLQKENFVMWASDGLKPDLGGTEDEESAIWGDEEKPTILCVPGFYDKVCVEVDLLHLDIDTILCNAALFENDVPHLDMNGYLGDAKAKKKEKGDTASVKVSDTWCLPVLRSIAQSLVLEATQNRSTSADSLLQNFFRWLRSAHSRFHDDTLFRAIRRLMKQVFVKLCLQLKNQGMSLVFASFQKLFISTGKRNLADGLRYVHNVFTYLKSIDVFRLVDLHSANVFEQLLFVDIRNYSGFGLSSTALSRLDDTDEVELFFFEQWNVLRCLAEPVQQLCIPLVREFLRSALSQRQVSETPSTAHHTAADRFNERNEVSDEVPSSMGAYLADVLGSHVLNIVENIHSHVSQFQKQDEGTSIRAVTGNPALDFTKFFFEVFSCDSRLREQANKVKKNCLKILAVKEFSKDDEFSLRSKSYALHDVICGFCMTVQDLDLFQDRTPDGQWPCQYCGGLFDPHDIEQRLLEHVQKLMVSFQVQDTYYHIPGRNSKEMKIDNMGDVKDLKEGLASYDVAEAIRMLRTIAEINSFADLQESISWFDF